MIPPPACSVPALATTPAIGEASVVCTAELWNLAAPKRKIHPAAAASQ